MLKTFFSALIFYSGSTFCYFYSFNHIGTGLSSAICSVNTVFITLYLWCFDKQKIKLSYLLALFFNLIGFCLILKDRKAINIELYGIAFAVLSGFLYACYIIANRNKSTNLNPMLSALMLFFANFIVYGVGSLYEGGAIIIPDVLRIWVMILTMSIFCTLLPIYFLLKALSYINASDVSMLGILRPVFAIIFGCIFLHESIGKIEAAGILLIFVGTIVNQWPSRKAKPLS
jgi:drug/metabolite transporter (DMT)-like permease